MSPTMAYDQSQKIIWELSLEDPGAFQDVESSGESTAMNFPPVDLPCAAFNLFLFPRIQ
jgi:hypothetical protein